MCERRGVLEEVCVRDVDVGGGVYERHEGESVRDEGRGVCER